MPDTLTSCQASTGRLDILVRREVVDRCQALRVMRVHRGLPQSEVAAVAQLDPEAVSRIERGLVDPLLPTYLALRNAVTGVGEQGWRAARLQTQAWVRLAAQTRRAKGIRKADFSVVGIAARQVTRFEQVEHMPLLSTAVRIAEVVGVDV